MAGSVSWRGETVSRHILGTAQLGMAYGIANECGRPTSTQATEMLDAAWRQGIRCFDTAQAYGESELVLGRSLATMGLSRQAAVISKFDPALDPRNTESLREAIHRSLQRLRVPCLWAMMLHRADWLDAWETVGAALRSARTEGGVVYFGASVYTATEAWRAISQKEIDIIELPCNAWDSRLLDAGVFEAARKAGKLCLVRSIYLQGLLTMSPDAVRERLPLAFPAAERWQAVCQKSGLGLMEAAVRFALALGVPLVIGAESVAQVAVNAELLERSPLPAAILREMAVYMRPAVAEAVLDPRCWSKRN